MHLNNPLIGAGICAYWLMVLFNSLLTGHEIFRNWMPECTVCEYDSCLRKLTPSTSLHFLLLSTKNTPISPPLFIQYPVQQLQLQNCIFSQTIIGRKYKIIGSRNTRMMVFGPGNPGFHWGSPTTLIQQRKYVLNICCILIFYTIPGYHGSITGHHVSNFVSFLRNISNW
jgi:hypothetical protein